MAKKKVSRSPKTFNASATTGQKALVIGAFAWGSMTDPEKRAAFEQGVLLAVAPHQWDNMMREQGMASQARDNLREELRVANLKLEQLDKRFRNDQIDHMHEVERLRSQLVAEREATSRMSRVAHAMIDAAAGARGQVHTLPDGRAFTLDEASKRFQPV